MESDLRLDNKGRMSREVHVRFREGQGVQFPRATRLGVVPVEGCEFLGFTFRGEQIRWTHKAEREFKRRVRRLTSRDPRSVCARGVSMEVRLAKLSQYVRG